MELVGHLSGHGGPSLPAKLRCLPCTALEAEAGVTDAGRVLCAYPQSPSRCARCGHYLAVTPDTLEVQTGDTRR